MVIAIQQSHIFKDVLVTATPAFFHLVIQKTCHFFYQHQIITNEKPYHFEQWVANIDTGVYVDTGKITSLDPAWEIDGFYQDLCYLDPPEIGVEHYLKMQNMAKGIRICMTTLSKDNQFTASFEIHLPFPLEGAYTERLLGGS